ncbi:hypothetical protein ACFWN1_16185 [Streptomyces sp. NPDC058459]|uniref:hypothetical protein n=1 Tax=Streptomyces sp. NPDC058459 TaxID=3346508 RepID=UPI00365A7086
MSNSTSDRAPVPQTLWAARGRHTGPTPEDVVRRTLRERHRSGELDDFSEPSAPGGSTRRVFEARWRAGGTVTVRARLTLVPGPERPGHEWTLVAESEQPWEEAWPSPATLFWPEGGAASGGDGGWDHHPTVPGLRFRQVNALPLDDKEMRRRLRDAAREAWCVNLVVHEAMTPDEGGKLPLAGLLPPGLRHRVIEHRASPQQFRAVNWALRDLGVEVPRGGAVLLPWDPAPDGYDRQAFSVRSVFLDGSEPADLIAALRDFASLSRPRPRGLGDALTELRDDWALTTPQEELERERHRVERYREALEAMTRSRNLYREAAEQAHEALAAYRDTPLPVLPQQRPSARDQSPLQQLTRTFEWLRLPSWGQRPGTPGTASEAAPDSGPAAGGGDRV